jgi:tripartite ATP-independent transporter DctP family solute receptor
MNTFTRRQALLGAGAAAAALAAPALMMPRLARGAEFNLKFGTNLPASHPLNIRALEAAERIAHDTDGQVRVTLFPNSQLGADSDMLSQLRAGAIDFFTVSGVNVLSQMVPVSSMYGLGFAFANDDAVHRAIDGDLGNYLRAQFNEAGLLAMDTIWSSGFRQITNSVRPVTGPAALANLKIRVPMSPLWISLFKHLEAAPTSMNFAEVYSSLQTRVVDGQENPLSIISISKLYEVQKYCSITNHMWDGYWCMSSHKAWNRLPQALRPIIARHLNRSGMDVRADVARLNASLRSDLQARGMLFNTTDPAPFRAMLSKSGFYAEWRRKYGEEAWAMLEKFTGKLG